jgi:DNA-binding YbaB/EbfC family protein
MRMVGQFGQIKENMAKLQEKLQKVVVEGQSGGGMVKVTMNGAFETLEVKIDQEALQDPETLGPLIAAAANAALRKSKEALQKETGELFGGVQLPPGFLGS